MKTEALYFLAVIPGQKVHGEVMGFKNQVAEKFDSKASLRSPPHITLHMPFKWKETREELLIQKLENFHFNDIPFEVELKDFGFFPPRVVFVNVVKNEKLESLQKTLSNYVRKELNLFNADYKEKSFHPHMTIAFRDLKKSRFAEARECYSDKKYETIFEVGNICLLKHDGKKWNEFRYFS